MVSFTYSSIVSASSNPSVVAGDTINGSISYDPTQLGSTGLFTFTGSAKVHDGNLSALHNGSQVYADLYSSNLLYTIKMTYNTTYKGQIGSLMEIKFHTVGGYTFDLKLFNLGNVGFTGPILPTTTTINNFALTSGDSSL